ncbi:P-loop containing nucleoside triphosphate hydrolase protein [Penicillium cosmopolitanum]|uniref:P-loop containing nucleoside triphosphate hydrolase protein n=1 Tax=Penicillium cosmopolitanum TaxID=1131564 RepID=A0A9W9W5D1_9EURO|nr:P-loop containing nucleoside triphosphate hydrolase protein [Penicillium cosmopolitanum]KAJ5403819.1 P-loop containing nucleoside triphosphate hydrolase protein [Penicillium cosmopolitanum]
MWDIKDYALEFRVTILVLTTCLTNFALQSLTNWARQAFRTTDQFAKYFYRDHHGESKLEDVQATTRWKQRVMITLLTTSAAAISLSRAVIVSPGKEWLHFSILLFLLIESVALLLESHCTVRYSLALRLSLSCVLGLVSLAFEIYAPHPSDLENLQRRLVGAECFCHLATAALCLLFPRRPDVHHNDIMVDRELSTSVLSRITFSWASNVIHLTHQEKELDPTQLPGLDYSTRSQSLRESFAEAKGAVTTKMPCGCTMPVPMWKILVQSNRTYLTLAAMLCLPLALLSFAPHMALLHILQVLESDPPEKNSSLQLGVWGVLLGLAIVCSSAFEQCVNWIAFNKISVRMIEQISIMVFDKAMRLTGSRSSDKSKDESGDDEDCSAKSTINLVAVDGKRIGRFATYAFHLVLAPLRLIIASVMLMKILGWQSLAAGLACIAVLMPMIIPAVADKRMAILTEVLHAIRQIKFSALEDKWLDKISLVKKEELSGQRRIFIANSGIMSFYILAPIVLSVASLGVYANLHNGLTASVTFTATSIMGSITISLSVLPTLLSNALDTLISTRRLDEYFRTPEKMPNITPSDTIGFQNATITWPGALTSQISPWFLRDLDLEFPRGKLSLISGRTGSGKRQVMAPLQPHPEIIWRTYASGGDWLLDSVTAYVAQIPWIEAATIKQNILFGLPFCEKRYRDVLYACALVKDLEIFPDGERTEVGPDGVNLSGGQKARISLARALYSRAGTLLLDDIFSAVDVHTAQHLYKHALTGPLAAGRTRILTTHHISICLPQTEYIVHLEDGAAEFTGAAAQLHDSGMLDSLLRSCNPDENLDENGEVTLEDVPSVPLEHFDEPARPTTSQSSRLIDHAPRTFVQKERGKTNKSSLRLSIQYMKASGRWWLWALVVAASVSYMLLILARSWWLRVWNNHDTETALNAPNMVLGNLKFYFGIYVAFSMCEWLVGSTVNFIVFLLALRASERLFRQSLRGVLSAPLQWLDAVPVGQILNRFSADLNVVDYQICLDLINMLAAGLESCSVVVAGIIVNPLLIILIIPLRQHASIFEKFNTSLTGLWTIRAYGKSEIYIEQMQQVVDSHARAYWHQWLLTRWFGTRINIIGAIFATCVALLVTSQNGADASAAGFAIGFTIQLNSAITLLTQVYAALELDLNSLDRVLEYSDVEPEQYDGIDPPAVWPTEGRLDITDLAVQYESDLPPVLCGLNIAIEGNQRVGIVGRTGAGKSSLALALFRFLEASQGKIIIDGLDIAKINLTHLRRRLAIIPQNPVLFSGTVRSNLDPFQEHDDSELLSALAEVRCTPSTAKFPLSELEMPISEGGMNLSQGQRQLLCLARAIVSNPKILMLDEATSSLDHATDEKIQQAVRERFGRGSSTLLVIAHRLSTIADFDHILVLDRGVAAEFGPPRDLINLENGIFRAMVDKDSDRDELLRIISG